MLSLSDRQLIGDLGVSWDEYSKFAWKIILHFLRMGFARLAEDIIRKYKGKGEGEQLTAVDKIASSSIGMQLIPRRILRHIRIKVCF